MSQTCNTVSLAPLEVWGVMLDDRTIKFNEPLMLTPQRVPDDPDEPSNQKYWQIVYPPLAIDVYAETLDDLRDAVHSNIRMNWKHYVQKDDSRLSSQTMAIKRAFLAVAEVIDG